MPIIHRPVLVFPEHEVTLDEVLEYLERAYAHTPNLDRALRAVKACEVKTRRYCRPLADLAPTTLGQRMRWHFSDACDFGEAAARQALTAAELDATDVDMLIAVSSAGYRMPGLDIALIERLNLVHTVRRMPVLHLGCAGAPYALNHAVEQASLYPGHITLLVFADMFIPFLHPDDTELDSMIFRGLMGDGAAACVVRGGDADHGPSIRDTWTCTLPGTSDIVGYRLDDDGFHGFNSARLFNVVKTFLPRLAEWLGDPPEFVIPHPGGPRILQLLAAGLPNGPALLDKARQSLAEHGNMGSPSTMDILARTFDDPPPVGSRGVLVGIGPGMTMIACHMEWR
jgi:predicted naringenin-chalcone synthase